GRRWSASALGPSWRRRRGSSRGKRPERWASWLLLRRRHRRLHPSAGLSEIPFPCLADEVSAEGAMRLRCRHPEARRFIETPCSMEDVVGPERHAPIARLAREMQRLLY